MPRNGSGTYSLPLPAVITNTNIESNWANTTLDDLATAMTDSLSRSGDGGMLVPFLNADGTVGAPGIAFSNEPTTGFYRQSANVIRMAVAGVDVLQIDDTNQISVWRNSAWESVTSGELTSADITDFATAALAACQASLDLKANLSGATFTGSVIIEKPTGYPVFGLVPADVSEAFVGQIVMQNASKTVNRMVIAGDQTGDQLYIRWANGAGGLRGQIAINASNNIVFTPGTNGHVQSDAAPTSGNDVVTKSHADANYTTQAWVNSQNFLKTVTSSDVTWARSSAGILTLTANQTYWLPAGLWTFSGPNTETMRILSNGENTLSYYGGGVYSPGDNSVGLKNTIGSSITINYVKW